MPAPLEPTGTSPPLLGFGLLALGVGALPIRSIELEPEDAGGLLSGPALVLIGIVALGVFLIARWERSRAPRHDPLSFVALGLLVLGQLLITQAALAGSQAGGPIPELATVRDARWVLVLAMLVAAASLVRIFLSGPRRRGIVFALVALIGAPATFPILGLLDVRAVDARIDGDLELARSSFAARTLFEEDPIPMIDVLVGGALRLAPSPESSPASFGDIHSSEQRERLQVELERLARALPSFDGALDSPVMLRIDRAAEFRHVREVLRAAHDAGFWKVLLAVAPTAQRIRGHLFLYMASYAALPEADSAHLVRLAWRDEAPRFELDGDPVPSTSELATRIATRARTAGARPFLLIPDDDVPWQAVTDALSDLAPRDHFDGSPGAFTLTHRE